MPYILQGHFRFWNTWIDGVILLLTCVLLFMTGCTSPAATTEPTKLSTTKEASAPPTTEEIAAEEETPTTSPLVTEEGADTASAAVESPEIINFVPDPFIVYINNSRKIQVNFKAHGHNDAHCVWGARRGTIQGQNDRRNDLVTYQAPATAGSDEIHVQVEYDGGDPIKSSVAVKVIEPPEIIGFAPEELEVIVGERIQLEVNVDEQNHTINDYQWSASAGRILDGQGKPSIIYEAPTTPGSYEVRVELKYTPRYQDPPIVKDATIVRVFPKPGTESTSIPSPSPTPTPAGCTPPDGITPALIAMPPDKPSYGLTEFKWKWSGGELPAQCGFEVRVWRKGETPLGIHNAILDKGNIEVMARNTYRLVADISEAPGVQGRAGEYQWTVLLVQVSPGYKELGIRAIPGTLYFEPTGGPADETQSTSSSSGGGTSGTDGKK
jgi:plastocyanin